MAGEAVANALRYGLEREGTERRALARPVEKDLVDERLLTCCVAPGVSGKTACAVLRSGEAVARGREFGEPPLSPAGPWPGGPLGTSVLSPGGGFCVRNLAGALALRAAVLLSPGSKVKTQVRGRE